MSSDPVSLIEMEYMGGDAITPNGSSIKTNMPSGANAFCIRARGGGIFYQMNAAASTNAPGFVPENMLDWQGYIANLDSVYVFAAAGAAVAHIQFFRQLV